MHCSPTVHTIGGYQTGMSFGHLKRKGISFNGYIDVAAIFHRRGGPIARMYREFSVHATTTKFRVSIASCLPYGFSISSIRPGVRFPPAFCVPASQRSCPNWSSISCLHQPWCTHPRRGHRTGRHMVHDVSPSKKFCIWLYGGLQKRVFCSHIATKWRVYLEFQGANIIDEIDL